MRVARLRWCVFLILAAGVPAAAIAQPATPALKPYKPVEVLLPAPLGDKSLDAFRKQLAGIAQRKDRAALTRLLAKDFFWDGDYGGMFDAKKPAIDNLSAAMRLADASGRGWTLLAAFAAESAIGAGSEHAQAQAQARCAPAQPGYDDAELAALTEATNTDVADWSYPRASGLQLRAKPEPTAPVVETLGLHLVRVLGHDGKERRDAAWSRIATPSGKVGYAPPGALVSPLADRLCFGRDGNGWRIVGYAGAGD